MAFAASLVAVSILVLVAPAVSASDGPVIAWGGTSVGPPPASVNGTDGIATAIAAGSGYHSCAIQAETRAVVCWGSNDFGKATPPTSVDGTDGIATAIAAGFDHSCAIRAGSDSVVCWGRNDVGQATPPPSINGTDGRASAIAVGAFHGCAIRAGGGAVVCWGFDLFRQASPPSTVDGTDGTATAIAAGAWHSCAIQAETGGVVCWGHNNYGQATPPPSVDGTDGTATALAAGRYHNCAIQHGTGAVVCWGYVPAPPAPVNGVDGTASAIAAGGDQSCAIAARTGAVLCWGGTLIPPPSVNGSSGGAAAIAIGSSHALAIRLWECSDGFDADGDGLIDYPADPGCDSSADLTEKGPGLVCDDGLDNDADLTRDYPADPGCSSPTDANERGADAACDDGQDDDGDELADFQNDPGCDSASDESENSPRLVCDDGVDNDGDSRVDYPGDENCASVWDPSEDPDACGDGLDNDGNGLVDYPADPSCADIHDHSERVAPVFEIVKEHLADGTTLTLDGDGNVYGWTPSVPWENTPASVFRIDATGGFRTTLTLPLDFVRSTSELTLGPDGAFYGTGAYLTSRVAEFFRIGLQGDYTSLGSLPSFSGWTPIGVSGLILGSDGAFYGRGGTHCPGFCGSAQFLIKLTTDGSVFFPEGPSVYYGTAVPSVVGSDGAIYGSVSGSGFERLFRLDTAGGFSILPPYIEGSVGSLALGADGLIYGTTRYGGARYGSVFRVDGAGNFTTLHEFTGADGGYPIARMTLGSDGALYGVTPEGGSAGWGTVFRVDPAGTVASLYSFQATDDGGVPEQPLALARDGTLYGVGGFGPAFFRVDPGGAVTPFLGPVDLTPASPLMQGSDCALYGVARTWADPASNPEAAIYRFFEPGQLCQQIDFAGLPDRILGEPPFTVSAAASSSLPVSFAASGSCAVSGDQVTLTGGGPCTLTASQPGDADFQPAPDVSQTFNVIFDFAGFLPPVENAPTFNRATAGQHVPVRFALGSDAGRNVLAEGAPAVRHISCETLEPLGEFQPAIARGPKTLRHRPGNARYSFSWKTHRDWAGSCRELSLELVDGTVHKAYFRLGGSDGVAGKPGRRAPKD